MLGTSMPMAGLAGDGGFDAHPHGCKREGDVVGQIGDFADFDACCRRELIAGHGGPTGRAQQRGFHPKLCSVSIILVEEAMTSSRPVEALPPGSRVKSESGGTR